MRSLKLKRGAYREAFRDDAGKVVLADLERFCHARKTIHVEGDTHGTAQLEGRRQVWLRVQAFLGLSEDDIDALQRRAQLLEGDDE